MKKEPESAPMVPALPLRRPAPSLQLRPEEKVIGSIPKPPTKTTIKKG